MLPPNAISISFYHTGNNPLGLIDPSPSYLSWPSTQGGSFYGQPWTFCPLGSTQQYQVFINNENFGIGGVSCSLTSCSGFMYANNILQPAGEHHASHNTPLGFLSIGVIMISPLKAGF